MNQDQSLEPGKMLDDRYRILRIIAEGGMSIIYEVEDLRLGGKMALKQMRELMARKEENELIIRQFTREAELLSRLSHINLPRVIDHFVHEGSRYLVEELIEGKTLEQLMEEKSPREEEEVLGWAVQICDAFDYLHGQKIIYRDLKPSNCILTPSGIIKVIDFGLVRIFSMGKPKDTIIMGTPGYAAPEQYGQEQTDPRSDIFSLGALMHHLLTGHDPQSTPFLFPEARTLNPKISEETEHILTKALNLDPAGRFQTIAEIRQVIKGERVIIEEAETFSYVAAEGDLKQVGISFATCIAGGVLGIISLVANPYFPWFATIAICYAPFWSYLLHSDYKRRRHEGKLAVVVTEKGVHYRDDRKRFFASWEEIKGMEFMKDRFFQVKKAEVETAKGSFSFFVDDKSTSGSLFDIRPLVNSEHLCSILIKQGRLKIQQPGREKYIRR